MKLIYFQAIICVLAVAAGRPINAAGVEFADKVTIKNEWVVAAVSPSIGRIVEFARRGGANVLKLNSAEGLAEAKDGYKNYGGDRVANSQQYDWFYSLHHPTLIPDESVDGRPWRLSEVSSTKVVIQSEVSRYLGTRMTRTVELLPGAPALKNTLRLEQVEPTVFPSLIWTITLVEPPDFTLLDSQHRYADGSWWSDLHINSRQSSSCLDAVTLCGERAVKFQPRNLDPKPKMGTLGQWLAAVYPHYLFVQQSARDPQGCYPDGASLEVFAMAGLQELETLGPQAHLRPGECLQHTVIWRLLPRPERPETDLVTYVRKELEK